MPGVPGGTGAALPAAERPAGPSLLSPASVMGLFLSLSLANSGRSELYCFCPHWHPARWGPLEVLRVDQVLEERAISSPSHPPPCSLRKASPLPQTHLLIAKSSHCHSAKVWLKKKKKSCNLEPHHPRPPSPGEHELHFKAQESLQPEAGAPVG